VERRRNRLLQRLEKLAQDPQLEPLVKGPLAAMQDKLARARTQQQRLALAQELTPAEEGPIRVAPPNGGGPPLTPQQRLEEAIRKGTVEQELQQGPDGLTPPQAARAEAIRKRGGNATQAELEELFRLNKLYPKNEVLHEIKVQLLMARGLSREEAVDYVGKGVLPPPPPGPPAPTPTSTILSDNVPLTPEQKIKLFDKDGKPLLTGYKVQYLAPPGQEIGKIQWEEERLRSFQQGAQANTFVMTEVAGKRVQWALQIKEASRDNLRVTYKLVELERPNAEFTIDEWVMKSAAGQVLQRGTGTVFEVTFPGPGNYVIQATGKTGWGNPFIEEVRVPI